MNIDIAFKEHGSVDTDIINTSKDMQLSKFGDVPLFHQPPTLLIKQCACACSFRLQPRPSIIRQFRPSSIPCVAVLQRSVMVKARKYVLRSHFSGLPKREDLEIVEEELPALKDGGQ